MQEADRALLVEAAAAAGEIAMGYWKRDPKAWDKPGEGPVTEADLAVNEMLEDRLRAARPNYGWLSEESRDDDARLAADRVFIVDPIDGTRAFMAGTSAFSHSLAIAERGRVVAAAVFLPAQDKMFSAASGAGAALNGAAIRVSDPGGVPSVLTGAKMAAPENWPGGVPQMARSFRPSLAYRMCLVAQGRFDAMITFRDAWEWDIAAGALIAEEAGGIVSDGHGQGLVFNSAGRLAPGCVAAGPGVHASLMERRIGA